jgi:steroid delta-isomerase-like uncharacterized protein
MPTMNVTATMTLDSRQLPDNVSRYLSAWNARDVSAVLAALAPGGSYADPATGGPLAGAALEQYLSGFFVAFPDLTFAVESVCGGDDYLTVAWTMRGTNSGPLNPGLPPTGASVALPGVDLFALDGGAIRSVQAFFDQKSLLGQLGLQVIVQPQALGPVKFGRALWLSAGSRAKPGAFSTTWIDVGDDAGRDEVIVRSRQLFAELVQMPGFIGATFTNVAGRLTTQTAWESEAAAHGIMKLVNHKDAMRRVFAGDLGVALHTSVWTPVRQNPLWVRCASCGQMEQYEPGGHSACGEPFPEQPPYW